MKNGYVSSIPYPVFKKKPIVELGGYNEKLYRNQDNDLNERLIKEGYKLYLTEKTSCKYYVDYNFKKLCDEINEKLSFLKIKKALKIKAFNKRFNIK